MRSGPLAVVALVSAVVGAVAVLAIGKAAGWVAAEKTTVVVNEQPSGDVAAPAVVRPVAKPLPGNAFDPAKIYAQRAPGVVTIYAVSDAENGGQAAQGSGFVVSKKGYILTNSHVITSAGEGSDRVEAADRVYVQFSDRDRVAAKIVGWDVFDDIGLIKVDPRDHPLVPVPLGDSSQVVVGEPVAAIGSPFGNDSSLGVGVVAATERSISSITSAYSLVDAIQTDAPINHGNSGGPLLDARGRVIGVVAQIRSDSGTAEGVAFAVPINSAKRSMRELIARGRVRYAYVGIKTQDLTPSIARRFGYAALHGAVIDQVNAGTPADEAGLRGGDREEDVLGAEFVRGGDVIVAIDGHPVADGGDVVRIVAEQLAPGDIATFTVLRGRKRLNIPVTLAERPVNPD